MNQFEKNEILQQVSSILQFCQVIVSKLSFSNPVKEASTTEHYNDHIRELANTDKEAHQELKETIAEFRDEEQEHHDIGKGSSCNFIGH